MVCISTHSSKSANISVTLLEIAVCQDDLPMLQLLMGRGAGPGGLKKPVLLFAAREWWFFARQAQNSVRTGNGSYFRKFGSVTR